jgi:hypothetical protein
MFKPKWATNVLGARFIREELGRPTPPKVTKEVGLITRWTKKNAKTIRSIKYAYGII